MKVVFHKHVAQDARRRNLGAFPFVLLMALGTGHASAQTDPAVSIDEEVTVIGQRTLRNFRLEVELARERVFGLFNSLNSDDEFDIQCRNLPRTGTRIPQRVCRPQYSDNVTRDAGEEFAFILRGCDTLSESCLERGSSRAQAIVSEAPVKDQQLAAEVQRIARENPEFRRAIVGYESVERRYRDARRAEGLGLRVSVAIVDTAGAVIPSSLAARRGEVVAPATIEIVTPEAPRGGFEADDDREGWLKLRYSVLADGTTADVTTVDSMPPGRDALSATAAVQSWTFEPATAEGAPIDWHNNLAIVVFNREQATHAAWADFAEAYEEVADLMSRERYVEAKSSNERMQLAFAATLEDMAFAQMQLAAIEHALGNPHAALDAIRRATEPAVQQLADEELVWALEHRFSLELELGRAADAVETYERRTELGRLPSRNPMARLGSALEQTLEAPETNLAVRGRIAGNGRWEHSLTWPTLAVGDVDGRSGDLQLAVECNRNKAALPFDEDVQMTIPAGWGECVLFAEGQPDTTFVAYEFKEPIN